MLDKHGLLLFSRTAPWPWELGFIVLMGIGIIALMISLQVIVDPGTMTRTRIVMGVTFIGLLVGIGLCLGLWLTS